MRILKLSAYYAPERVSSSHLSRDLEQALLASGFTFENYVPTPTRGVSRDVYLQYQSIPYEELENGRICVHRFRMFREGRNPIARALRYVLVNLCQYAKGSRAEGIRLVYGGSTPPTQGVLCAMVARRLSRRYGKKVPFVYNLQDVFPDSLVTTGLCKRNSLLYRLGAKVAAFTYRHADAIIVISRDIRDNLLQKGVPEDKLHLIYNWIDTQAVRPVAPEDNRLYTELGISPDTFKVVYAGNLGKAQGVDTLLRAAEALQATPHIEFLIFGAGAEEDALKRRAESLSNVRFFPLLPQERVPEVYSLGNACAVMCTPGTGGTGLPSKTFTIMACGRPLLLSFDPGSELEQTVQAANAGLCAGAGDGDALARQIEYLYQNPEAAAAMGMNARRYATEHADRAAATEQYAALLRGLAEKS